MSWILWKRLWENTLLIELIHPCGWTCSVWFSGSHLCSPEHEKQKFLLFSTAPPGSVEVGIINVRAELNVQQETLLTLKGDEKGKAEGSPENAAASSSVTLSTAPRCSCFQRLFHWFPSKLCLVLSALIQRCCPEPIRAGRNTSSLEKKGAKGGKCSSAALPQDNDGGDKVANLGKEVLWHTINNEKYRIIGPKVWVRIHQRAMSWFLLIHRTVKENILSCMNRNRTCVFTHEQEKFCFT